MDTLKTEFIDKYNRGELTPLTKVPAVATDTTKMEPFDWALNLHHGMVIRYLKWQTDLFAIAKAYNVTPLALAELAYFQGFTHGIVGYKEEDNFLVAFLKQNGKPI
jgi:hypothetical protein